MIYSYDQNIQMPVKDLYDTQMMAIAINAAKDMYDNARLEIKDFNKLYGDFITPIAADQDWYDKNVIGKFLKEINNMYAQGIDPLRSAEGRSRIAQLINNLPVKDINNRRLAASNAEQYLKNKAELEAKGLYNPDLEERFLKYDLSKWDTGVNGVWNRISPIQSRGLKDVTSDWFDKRTAHDLTKEEVAKFGEKYDPMYKYQGFTDDDLMNIASQRMPGFNGSVWSNYYRDIAMRELQAEGNSNPTQELIEARLLRDIADANQEYLIKPVKTVDPIKAKEYESNLAYNNFKRQWDYQIRHPKPSSRGGGSGGGGSNDFPDSVYARDRAAMIAKISGTSGSDLWRKDALAAAAANVKSHQIQFSNQFELNFGQTVRRFSSAMLTPWGGMNTPLALQAFNDYKQSLGVPIGKEQWYEARGIKPRDDNSFGESALRQIPVANVISDLIAPEDFITNTTGMVDGSETHNTASMRVNMPKDAYVVPQDWAMSPMQKDGRLHQVQWMDVFDARGNKIAEVLYDEHITSDYPRDIDGNRQLNAGLTFSGPGYIANTSISSESAPTATYKGRNLDKALNMKNAFDNSMTLFGVDFEDEEDTEQ